MGIGGIFNTRKGNFQYEISLFLYLTTLSDIVD